MKKIIKELRRRNVIKATFAYLVVAWLLLQVASVILPIVEAPDWILKAFVFILAVGLPIWIVISWIYDFTPQGIEKTPAVTEDQIVSQLTNNRLNTFILVGLIVAAVILALNVSVFSSKTDRTIAILPFENLISDEGNEWLSKGVTSDIRSYLSKIEDLDVISELAINDAFRDTLKPINEIAKELGATYILKGSVRQIDNVVIISAHLINVQSNRDEWGDSYPESLDDPFKIQQQVSKKIVQQLNVTISLEEEQELNISPTQSKEAYRLFTQGRAIADTRDREKIDLVIDLYSQAISIDPNYADAYAELAHIKRIFSRENYKGEIEDLNEKALRINPNTARVYSTRAFIYLMMGSEYFEEAKENFEKALEINPNDDTAHHHLALYYSFLLIPDVKNQLFHIRKAHKLNPTSNPINNVFLYALLNNDRIEEAEEQFEKVKSSFEDFVKEEFRGLINSHKKKDFSEAITNMNRAIEKNPNDPGLHWLLGRYYNNILNDDVNYLKHSKIAFELDSSQTNYVWQYYRSLLENKKLREAKELLSNYPTNPLALSRYYFAADSLEKAWEYVNKANHRYTTEIRLSILSRMGERDSIYDIFNNKQIYNSEKVIVYAILNEKDSMYHYLNSINSKDRIMLLNGDNSINPYRHESKFKAILRKNYLPIEN